MIFAQVLVLWLIPAAIILLAIIVAVLPGEG